MQIEGLWEAMRKVRKEIENIRISVENGRFRLKNIDVSDDASMMRSEIV